MGPRLSKSKVIDRETLQNLVEVRLAEAHALRNARFYAGAVYLGGYALECQLKAVICGTLGLDKLPGTFNTHDIDLLLFHSGLYRKIEEVAAVEDSLKKARGLWNGKADLRHRSPDESKEKDATLFLEWIEDPEKGVLSWLRRMS